MVWATPSLFDELTEPAYFVPPEDQMTVVSGDPSVRRERRISLTFRDVSV
jgi:hypothetical protein